MVFLNESILENIFLFQIEKSKSGNEPGSCEEHASLVKHSDTNGTNVWLRIEPSP